MSRQFSIAAAVCVPVIALFFTSCKSYDVAARYTSKYISANNGKLSAQVSETYELGYAMLALTTLAQNDTSLINKNTLYYQDLMAWVGQHQNYKGVLQLNADLGRNPGLVKSYLAGLYAFQINNGRVVLKSNYRIDLNKVDFKRYALLLQNFYKATNFHEFYTRHEDFYAGMIQSANNHYTFADMQKNLNDKANSYRIILSPLTKGYAGTLCIKGHDYNECIIFPKLAANGQTYALKDAITGGKLAG